MATLMRRTPPPFPEFLSFLDNMWPFTDYRSIPVETYLEGDRFVLRAELPGIDPGKDAEITVDHGRLTVTARREQRREDARHSEFHYGEYTRSVLLPAGTRVDDISASYHDGILEVAAPVETGAAKPAKIEITTEE